MERKITKLEHSHVEVLVTVDQNVWKAAQKKAYNKQAANITVKGFRKGKAPENLVKDKVDQFKVKDDAINELLPGIYRLIIEEDKIIPHAQPSVELVKASDDELVVKFVLVVAPEVKLGKYKGLAIGKEEANVTEEDINNSIQELLKNSGSLVVKEGASELGDTVVIDFVGTVDGAPFDGGSATNHELELGSHSFIPGFEEQLVGHKAGEHVDVNVKFPEDYVENLKGKDAVFACDIHEVKAKQLPELNDEFVKELNIANVETVAQLKDHQRNDLLKKKEEEARNSYIKKLIEAIMQDSEVDIPQEIIDQQVKGQIQDLENRMAQSGLTVDQYLQIIGQSKEEFEGQQKVDAEKNIARYYIIEKISELENLEVSEEEVEFEMAKLADQYGMKIEDVKKALANQMGAYRNELKNRKVEDFLLDNNE